ncbi:DUF6285 domain-containing protein [soil metagenome]
MTEIFGRPTAAELIAAVAQFLDHEVRDAVTGSVNFHARVAANALRMVERELLAPEPVDVAAALETLGVENEADLAAAIRRGAMDDRGADLASGLRALVGHRLAAAHPGYEDE